MGFLRPKKVVFALTTCAGIVCQLLIAYFLGYRDRKKYNSNYTIDCVINDCTFNMSAAESHPILIIDNDSEQIDTNISTICGHRE